MRVAGVTPKSHQHECDCREVLSTCVRGISVLATFDLSRQQPQTLNAEVVFLNVFKEFIQEICLVTLHRQVYIPLKKKKVSQQEKKKR